MTITLLVIGVGTVAVLVVGVVLYRWVGWVRVQEPDYEHRLRVLDPETYAQRDAKRRSLLEVQ